uniref:Uncharacterized protein n=1 Tax=Strongyloides venezuelensis TaxID=75913 RepID=A0A0K0G0N3_STRVS
MGPEYLKEMEEEDIKNVDCCFICYPTIPPCKHNEISLNEFVKEYTKRKDNDSKLINEKDISITIPSNEFEKEQLF